MQDFDSAVMLAGTQLLAYSRHLVRQLERLTQRLSLEHEEISASSTPGGAVRVDLLSALELQRQVVAEHFALVRLMSPKLRRQQRMTEARSMDAGPLEGQWRSRRSRRLPGENKQSSGPGESNALSFTVRQRQIIQLVALRYDNKQIGQSLSIAEQTVKNHLATIFRKAGVSRRSELAIYTYETNNGHSENLLEGRSPAPASSTLIHSLVERTGK